MVQDQRWGRASLPRSRCVSPPGRRGRQLGASKERNRGERSMLAWALRILKGPALIYGHWRLETQWMVGVTSNKPIYPSLPCLPRGHEWESFFILSLEVWFLVSWGASLLLPSQVTIVDLWQVHLCWRPSGQEFSSPETPNLKTLSPCKDRAARHVCVV